MSLQPSEPLQHGAARRVSTSTAELPARPAVWNREPMRRNQENGVEETSFRGDLCREFRKWMRHDSRAFFYRNNFVDRHAGELLDLPARPGYFQGIDLGPFAEPKENARIACRHVAHAALGLFDMRNSFRG